MSFEELFANQTNLLSAPTRGFNRYRPIFVKDPLKEARARIKRAEENFRAAQAELEAAQQELAKVESEEG